MDNPCRIAHRTVRNRMCQWCGLLANSNLTNWFSASTCHHIGQNVVDYKAQPSESTTNFDHCDNTYLLSIRVQTTLHHIQFVFYQSSQLKTPTQTWKCMRCTIQMSTCTRQTFFSKNFKSNDAYWLSIRVQTTLNHISVCFLPKYQHQRKSFFQSVNW